MKIRRSKLILAYVSLLQNQFEKRTRNIAGVDRNYSGMPRSRMAQRDMATSLSFKHETCMFERFDHFIRPQARQSWRHGQATIGVRTITPSVMDLSGSGSSGSGSP